MHMIPTQVQRWLKENGFGTVRRSSPVGGGCINNGTIVNTSEGNAFFLKTNPAAPADMFECEAAGLSELQQENAPRVPSCYLWGKDFIVMEYIPSAGRSGNYWAAFGRQLAGLHDYIAEQYGFHHDNYIGSTPQPNPRVSDGYEFFGEHRLNYQVKLARNRGYLNGRHTQQVNSLVNRLPEVIPQQPPSLLHGDLWSGNVIVDENGNPVIIDPAAYYGWAEAELAMTTLFGSFPAVFYEAYVEERPLDIGYRERFPIYNLYHLLNHLNLFGSSYLPQVISILNRYS